MVMVCGAAIDEGEEVCGDGVVAGAFAFTGVGPAVEENLLGDCIPCLVDY